MNNFPSSAVTPTFTPVRRKDSTLDPVRLQSDPEQEWNAARCHRLLRALKSRVAILTKEIDRFSIATQHDKEPKAPSAYQYKGHVTEDADWTQTRKKVRQTYSSRGRGRGRGRSNNDIALRTSSEVQIRNGRRFLEPGEVDVPTPVFARAKGEDIISQNNLITGVAPVSHPDIRARKRARNGDAISNYAPGLQLSEPLRDMRKKLTANRYTTYEGIYNGLEILLRSTAKNEPEVKRTGARSLFSTALRAVPKYISQQEKLLETHAEEVGGKSAINSRDISSEIYDELESLGSTGKSWKELRTVVRSHGVEIVSDAIEAGLLCVDFCGSLITLCVSMSALEEAESLLSALLCSGRFLEPKTLDDTMNRRLVMLSRYAKYTGRTWFHHRQLSELISTGSLPISWFATKESGGFWTTLIQSMSPESIHADTLRFLDVALPSLAMARSVTNDGFGPKALASTALLEALQNTLSSLLTTLSSIYILSTEARAESNASSAAPWEYHRIVTLLRGCIAESKPNLGDTNPQFALLLLSILAVEPQMDHDLDVKSRHCQLLLDHLGKQDEETLYIDFGCADLAMFVSNMARCCGRGASTSGFDYLLRLHALLEPLTDEPGSGDAFKGIIVDSAYLFSGRIPTLQHLDYAAAVDAKYASRVLKLSRDTKNGHQEELRSGFRWEEGIGEWVHATPMVSNKNKPKSAVQYSIADDEDSDYDTPLRPPPQLRRIIGIDICNSSAKHKRTTSREKSPSAIESQSEGSTTTAGENEPMGSTSISDIASPSSDGSGSAAEESDSEKSFTSSQSSINREDDEKENSPGMIRRALRPRRRSSRLSQKLQLCGDSKASASSSRSDTPSSSSSHSHVVGAPRLGRRSLDSSQTWQVYEESDDELSFVSVTQSSHIMQNMEKNTVDSKTRAGRRGRPLLKQRKVLNVSLSDSEDELCH